MWWTSGADWNAVASATLTRNDCFLWDGRQPTVTMKEAIYGTLYTHTALTLTHMNRFKYQRISMSSRNIQMNAWIILNILCVLAPTTFTILILCANTDFTFRRTHIFPSYAFLLRVHLFSIKINMERKLPPLEATKKVEHKSKIALCFPPEDFSRCPHAMLLLLRANKFDCCRTQFDIGVLLARIDFDRLELYPTIDSDTNLRH